MSRAKRLSIALSFFLAVSVIANIVFYDRARYVRSLYHREYDQPFIDLAIEEHLRQEYPDPTLENRATLLEYSVPIAVSLEGVRCVELRPRPHLQGGFRTYCFDSVSHQLISSHRDVH